MGYMDPDVYGQPENFGLRLLIMLEDEDLSWEFDMFGVWISGIDTLFPQLYYGCDSGCSCPSPFEDFNSIDDLTPATKRGIIENAKLWGATADQMMRLVDALDDLEDER